VREGLARGEDRDECVQGRMDGCGSFAFSLVDHSLGSYRRDDLDDGVELLCVGEVSAVSFAAPLQSSEIS